MQETPNAIDVGLKWISQTFYEQIFCLFPISKNLQTQIVRTEKLPKTILHEEAAHKTFLQAPFEPIFLCQKITKPNLSRGKLCKTILHEKGAHKMLVKLTPGWKQRRWIVNHLLDCRIERFSRTQLLFA